MGEQNVRDAPQHTDAGAFPDRGETSGIDGHALVAVLAVDIVGSTELRRSIGEAAAAALHDACDRAMLACVSARDGRTIRRTGDGIIAALPSITSAIEAMYEIQSELGAIRIKGHDVDVRIRAVIDIGDIDWNEDQPVGSVLDRANRLLDALDGTDLVCTPTAAAVAQRTSDIRIEDGPIAGTVIPIRTAG